MGVGRGNGETQGDENDRIQFTVPGYVKPSIIDNTKNTRIREKAAAEEKSKVDSFKSFEDYDINEGQEVIQMSQEEIAEALEADRQEEVARASRAAAEKKKTEARLAEVKATFANRPSTKDRIAKINNPEAEKAAASKQLQKSAKKDAEPKGLWGKAKKLFGR